MSEFPRLLQIHYPLHTGLQWSFGSPQKVGSLASVVRLHPPLKHCSVFPASRYSTPSFLKLASQVLEVSVPKNVSPLWRRLFWRRIFRSDEFRSASLSTRTYTPRGQVWLNSPPG